LDAWVGPANRVVIYSKIWIMTSSYSYFVDVVEIKDKNLFLFLSIIILNFAKLKRLNDNIILRRLLNLKQLIIPSINEVRILISLLAKLTMESLPWNSGNKLRCTFMLISSQPLLDACNMNEMHRAWALARWYERIVRQVVVWEANAADWCKFLVNIAWVYELMEVFGP
jgi:hypothetical protein